MTAQPLCGVLRSTCCCYGACMCVYMRYDVPVCMCMCMPKHMCIGGGAKCVLTADTHKQAHSHIQAHSRTRTHAPAQSPRRARRAET
jgi:hypothetical protein